MKLMQAGPDVTDLLDPYRVERHPRAEDQCWVLANMVAGLDGTAAVAGRVGALSHGADTQLFVRMRAVPDIVLVGAETVRAERYGPVRLCDELRAERIADGRPPVPRLAIVTRSLRLDWAGPVFAPATTDGERPIIVTCASADPVAVERAGAVAEVIVTGDELVDLGVALTELRRRGHEVVLCEGGPTLLGALVGGGLLDELCLSISPVMGGDPLPVAITPADGHVTEFDLVHVGEDGGTLFLRYEVRRP